MQFYKPDILFMARISSMPFYVTGAWLSAVILTQLQDINFQISSFLDT